MIQNVINDEGLPIEIARGRGDLRRSSVPFNTSIRRGLPLVDRHISFANLFATQPMIGTQVGWFMRQCRRVPLRTYRRESDDGRKVLEPGDDPLAAGIAEPWERGSWLSLTASILMSFLVHGNSITEFDQGASNRILFTPADWRYAKPIMPWRDSISGWELDSDDPTVARTRGAEKVLHVADFSPLGPFGVSPLEQLGVTIAIEDAAQRHQRAMLANGVRSAAVVQSTDDRFFGWTPEERKELMAGLREDVEDTQSGPENSGRPWVVPPGMEVKTTGQTAVEADLIEQRIVNRTEAGGIYGLPPYTTGVIERSAELPEQRQIAYQDGLAPPLILIEACINSQIVKPLLRSDDLYVAYDFSQILRGDRLKEIEAIQKAIATAVMTPNEGNTELGKPRSDQPGMDDYYLPRNNLIPLKIPYQPKGAAIGGDPANEGASE